jgi:hypothetical protein
MRNEEKQGKVGDDSMAGFKLSGNFKHTELFLNKALTRDYMRVLHKYGKKGVDALSAATPVDSGKTAQSWSYEIKESYRGGITLYWTNSNVVDDVSIAIILQYGHGTKNGGYVQGYDYINPALKSIFADILEELWREVTR